MSNEPSAEFPLFFVSDSSLTTKTSHEITVKVTGRASVRGFDGFPYCIVVADGRWACGGTDEEGKTHPVYAESGRTFNVYAGVDAIELWNRHVGGKPISPPKPNCSQLPQTSGTDATVIFRCEVR